MECEPTISTISIGFKISAKSFLRDVPRMCAFRTSSFCLLSSLQRRPMADETPPPPPPAIPQTVPHTPAVAIWSLILAVLSFYVRLAVHRNPCSNLRSRCSFENSQVWRRARRKRNRDGRADFRLHRSCALYYGYPATCQHDPVGSRAVTTAFH